MKQKVSLVTLAAEDWLELVSHGAVPLLGFSDHGGTVCMALFVLNG